MKRFGIIPKAKRDPTSKAGKIRTLLSDGGLNYLEIAERLGIEPRAAVSILGPMKTAGQIRADLSVKPARYYLKEQS